MKRYALGALLAIAAAVPAWSAEQRRCDFTLAVFPGDGTERVDWRMVIAAEGGAARVRVERSGEWAARRAPTASGGDVVTFETSAAWETVTIGPDGDALWDIAYYDPAAAEGRVIAFAGTCDAWADR